MTRSIRFIAASFTPASPLAAVKILKPKVSMLALYSSRAGAKSSIHSNVVPLLVVDRLGLRTALRLTALSLEDGRVHLRESCVETLCLAIRAILLPYAHS